MYSKIQNIANSIKNHLKKITRNLEGLYSLNLVYKYYLQED